MGFHEVNYPIALCYGTRGGPTMNTKGVQLTSGQVQAVARWAAPRFHYDLANPLREIDRIAELLHFYVARLGPANGFRFTDPFHYTTAANHRDAATNADATLGSGDTATTQFQLIKTYTSGGYTVNKTLYKPQSGTVKVALNGSDQGAAGGSWNVDITTGIITFNSAPDSGVVVTAGCSFDIPVRFSFEMDTNLLFDYTSFQQASIDSAPLDEIIDPTSIDEEFPYGGANELTFSSAISISSLRGRALTLVPASALSVYLPAPATYPSGGHHFFIWNNSAFTLTFKVGSTTQFTLTGGSKARLIIGYDSGVLKWLAY